LNSMAPKMSMAKMGKPLIIAQSSIGRSKMRSASNDPPRSSSNNQVPGLGGRKEVAHKATDNNQLALKMQYVEGLTTPVPNQSIRLFQGRALEVSVDNSDHKSVFEILTKDQMEQVQSINIRLDLVVNARGMKECMITVLSASAERKGVTVDDRSIAEGCSTPAKAGSLIAFGDVLVLRVAVLKTKKNAPIEFKSSKVQAKHGKVASKQSSTGGQATWTSEASSNGH